MKISLFDQWQRGSHKNAVATLQRAQLLEGPWDVVAETLHWTWRNKEGGKSLCRKWIFDFCQYTIRLSPIFKAFAREK